jgi:hypothetical protein
MTSDSNANTVSQDVSLWLKGRRHGPAKMEGCGSGSYSLVSKLPWTKLVQAYRGGKMFDQCFCGSCGAVEGATIPTIASSS